MFIGIVIGITVGLEVNAVSIPNQKSYIEFVDQNGNDFPVIIDLRASYITRNSTGHNGNVELNNEALIINRLGGQNIFELNLPAFDYTTTVETHVRGISNVRIENPMPGVKSFSLFPENGLLPVKNTSMRLWYGWNPPTFQFVFNDSLLRFVKQSDNKFKLESSLQPSGFGSGLLAFGLREVYPNDSYTTYGIDETIRFYANYYQIKEIFEDETGASIPAPSGFTDGKTTDITSQPFNYQMTNDTNLPKTYVDGSFFYTYEGWYRGAGNDTSIITTHPPSINFNATLNDPQNEVHIVYEKKALRIVDEDYIDTSGVTIESSWNNMGQPKADGDTLTATPAATKTDSSGTDWEYQGWKLGSEPMSAMKTTPVSVLIDANKTVQYVYKKVEHTITEKWVDSSDGTTLVPMPSNPKTSAIDDNDNFNGTAPATIIDSTSAVWDYVGWENVTDAPGTMNSSPAYAVNNIKGNKEIRYHYQARNTTATLDLTPSPQVVSSGGNVTWSSRLTNTGSSALNNLKLKATSNWATGLSAPTQVTVTPAGGSPQNFTVTPSDWVSGFNLTGISIPSGGTNNYADITFTDTATGAVNQVLPAEIEVDGNMANPLKADNFVRIDDPDEPNLKPQGAAGLINIPEFRFGDVEVKPYAQNKTLDSGSYQSGYNPYIRLFDDESPTSTWVLSGKLGQFTSGSQTLPTTTSITLKNGTLNKVQNYNKSNESLVFDSASGNRTIASDSTSVGFDFGSNGVYQLDYALNDVELNLMAHSGVAGLSYTATMDWTLTTAP